MTKTTKIHPLTQEVLDAIIADESERIVSCIYTWAFKSRAHVSAAFRIANERGLIEVIGHGGNNNNRIYRRVR